jgi:hypothetical protein
MCGLRAIAWGSQLRFLFAVARSDPSHRRLWKVAGCHAILGAEAAEGGAVVLEQVDVGTLDSFEPEGAARIENYAGPRAR